MCIYSWMCDLHWNMANILGTLSIKKAPFPRNYQLPITSYLGVGLHAHFLSLCWDFVWLELRQLFCVRSQLHMLPCGHLLSLTLTVFLFLSHGDRWVLTGLIDRDVPFKSKHSEISYSLHFDQFQSLWRIYSNPVQKIQRLLYQSFQWSGNARFDSAHRIDKYSQGTG